MEIRHLEAFLAVVQEGSINKAAQSLHIAQPPLSRQLKSLEESLQIQLFIRGSREIKLTPQGHLFLERAREILNLVNQTQQELLNSSQQVLGVLSLAAIATAATIDLPKIIANYQPQFPQVSFKLWEGDSQRVHDLLAKGLAEIGFVSPPFDSETYNTLALPAEKLCIIYNKKNFDFQNQTSISLLAISQLPLLIHHKYLPLIEKVCTPAQLTPNIFCQSDDILPLIAWAKNGLGLAIVTSTAYNIFTHPDLATLPFTEELLSTGRGVIWSKKRRLSPAALKFIDVIGNYIQTHTN